MRYHQVKDLVIWAADFHQRMAQQFSDAARRTESERSSMVLNYLAEREKRMQSGLEAIFSDGCDHREVLETWFDDPTDFPQPPTLAQLAEKRVVHDDTDAAAETALSANKSLQALYEYRAETAGIEPEQTFFESLAQGHENETRQIVTHLREFSDL